MADVNLGSVSITARFLTGRFRRDVDRSKGIMDRHRREIQAFSRAFRRGANDIRSAGVAVTRFAAGIAAVSAAYATGVRGAIAYAAEISRSAQRAQVSTTTFQAYANALRGFGADIDDTRDGLADLAEALSEFAAIGAGPLADFRNVFDSAFLGRLREATTVSERIAEVLRTVASTEQGQQQIILNRLTDSTFGQSLLQLVREFGGDVDRLIAVQRERGLILPDEVIQQSRVLDQQIGNLQAILRNQFTSLLVSNTETIQGLLVAIERNIPDFTARLGVLFTRLDQNFEGLVTVLTRVVLPATGSIAPGLGIGRLAGELRVARLRSLQDLARGQSTLALQGIGALTPLLGPLTRMGAPAGMLQGLRDNIDSFSKQVDESAEAMEKHSDAIKKTTGTFATVARSAIGMVSAFGALSAGIYIFSRIIENATRVTPTDLITEIAEVAASLRQARADGSEFRSSVLESQLSALLDQAERFGRANLQAREAEQRAIEGRLADDRNVLGTLRDFLGRQVDAARQYGSTIGVSQDARDRERLAEVQQELNEAAANYNDILATYREELGLQSRDEVEAAQRARDREALYRSVLPYLSENHRRTQQIWDVTKLLNQAFKENIITADQRSDAMARLILQEQEAAQAIDLSTNALIRNTRARLDARNAAQATITDLQNQQAILDAELAAGPFGLSSADRAEAERRAQFASDQARLDRELARARTEQLAIQSEAARIQASGGTVDPGELARADAAVAASEARVKAYQAEAGVREKIVEMDRQAADTQDLITARAELFQTAIDGMSNAFATAIIDADSFGDAIKRLGVEILGLVLNGAIRAFFQGFGGETGFGGVGNFFGGFFGGKQFGGPLYAGQTAVVGEAGPELITAARPVRVIPNHQIGRQQQAPITIYQTIQAGTWTPTETARAIQLQLDAATVEGATAQNSNARTQLNRNYR